MSSTSPSDSDTDASPPSYTCIDPGCPVCGNMKFTSTEEGVPNGFHSHYVYVTCATCRTHFTIEYRAIDLFWYDGGDGQHSAVSQGFLDPTDSEYAEAAQYGSLPDSDILLSLDWPLSCPECDERLSGNDFATDLDRDDPDDDALFRCPNCEHLTKKPADHTTSDAPSTNG